MVRHPFGLDDAQLARYARHLILPEIGGRGQRALLDSVVGLEGDGPALGEALAFLAAAGVGRIILAADIDAAMSDHVAALNPDVGLAPAPEPASHEGPSLRVHAAGTYADGALAALQAVLRLAGRPETAWRVDPDIPGLSSLPEAPP